MAVKAELKIQLLANDVLVAESVDEKLWQRVLASIQSGGSNDQLPVDTFEVEPNGLQQIAQGGSTAVIDKFASDIGLTSDVVEAACTPSSEAPFIHLDEHCWEALKKNTPPRGAKAVAAINLAATLLCLWFKRAGIEGKPTPAQAKAVLDTIGVQESNPTRAVKNCDWLQSRAGGIQLNPAKVTKAKTIAKAYCSQQPVSGED